MIKMRMDAPARRVGEVVKKLKNPWNRAASPIPRTDALRIDLDSSQATPTEYPHIEEKIACVRGDANALPKSSKPCI